MTHSPSAQPMPAFDRLFIDGQWTAPATSETIDVFSARDGSVLGTVPAGDADDVDSALRQRLPRYPAGRRPIRRNARISCRRSPTG